MKEDDILNFLICGWIDIIKHVLLSKLGLIRLYLNKIYTSKDGLTFYYIIKNRKEPLMLKSLNFSEMESELTI